MKEEINKTFSRRDFLKSTTAGVVGVTAAGVMGGCAPKTVQSEPAAIEGEVSQAPAVLEADSTIETDVVVIGTGTSGILAASSAAANGAKVIAIETLPNLGTTNAVMTAGAFGVESTPQKNNEGYLTQEEAFNYLIEGTHYQCNSRAVRNIIAHSGAGLDLLIDNGVEFVYEFEMGRSDSIMSRGGHLFAKSGAERAEQYQKVMDTYGVTTMFSTTAQTLLMDGDSVVGVQCKADDNTILDIKAKSVIVCTGGFMANKEMIAEHFAGAELMAMGSYSNKGDGITMAQAAGAQLGKNFSISLNECGAGNSKASKRAANVPTEGADYNGVFYLPILGGLIVNKKGERFFNEAKMCEDTMYSGEVVIRDDLYYSVVDQAYLERLTSTGIIDFLGATSNMAPMIEMAFQGVVLTNIFDSYNEAIEEGWAFKADTIEELAEFFGMEELPATIEQYNQYCEAGKDDEFFKKDTYLNAVAEGPFYVAEFQPCSWVTFGGLKTDKDCRVLNAENDVIPGLYVAGVDGDYWSTPYYLGGSAQGFCIASGFLAGKMASGYAKEAA